MRDELVEELRRWRRDPIKDKKARKELARQMVDGPPGPQRTAWNAAETALTLVAAALARKAVARFLTDEPAETSQRTAAEPTPARRPRPAARRRSGQGDPSRRASRPRRLRDSGEPEPTEYSGWSSR